MIEPAVLRTRPGLARKRSSILEVARELFLVEGYERTSVDAVSARAGVSKRTVYDYFGDKRALFSAVVEVESTSLMASLRAAVAEELRDDVELGAALLAFARRVATQTLSSSSYAVLRRLLATRTGHPRGAGAPPTPLADPEQLLAERFIAYAQAGLLRTEKPRRAAEHFSALTLLLAPDAVQPGAWEELDTERVDEILVDGVHAFLPACATGAPPPVG